MTSIEIEDPETGGKVRLAVLTSKKGKEYYRRIDPSTYDKNLRSPRQLEAMATFSEVASRAYGKKSAPDRQAAASEVQRIFSTAFPKAPTRREIRAREKQALYTALIGEETARELREVHRAGVSLKAKVKRRLPRRVAITERELPEPFLAPTPIY